jgi:hypothetical protein
MKIELAPIGFVKTDIEQVSRRWTISDAEGTIEEIFGHAEVLR